MGSFDLRRFNSAQSLAQSAAVDWVEEISSHLTSGVFSTAFAGGRIAGNFFSEIAVLVKDRRVALTHMHFFWGDERCVPPTDPESNFRMAHELLLAPANIPAGQIHRILGEDPPEKAAAAAEEELRSVVSARLDDQAVLDLVLLGMGEEGHVASLFPGEPEPVITSRAVYRPVKAVKPPPLRVTLGYPALAAAREVWVLASGAGKEAALRESLKPNGNTPLARVLRLRSFTRIYSDCEI